MQTLNKFTVLIILICVILVSLLLIHSQQNTVPLEKLSQEISLRDTPQIQPSISTSPTVSDNPSTPNETFVQLTEILVTDLWGIPIPEGVINLDGNEYSFCEGNLRIESLSQSKHHVSVTAPDYQSCEMDIVTPVSEPVKVELDYLSSITFTVKGSHLHPSLDGPATVTLRKGSQPVRPLDDLIVLRYKWPWEKKYSTIDLNRVDGVIQVGEVNLVLDDRYGIGSPAERETRLEKGDQLIQICSYPDGFANVPGMKSVSLRIWDALWILGDYDVSFGKYVYCDVIRDGKTRECYIGYFQGIEEPQGDVFEEKVTDSKGQCRFENLPPGLYYAQANVGEKRSWIVPILPWESQKTLTVEYSTCELFFIIDLCCGGRSTALPIYESTIILQSEERESPIWMITQTDYNGYGKFSGVPWGKYNVSICPPSSIAGKPKEITVDIQEGGKTITACFEGDCYRISGDVVRSDTHQPVEGIKIDLDRQYEQANRLSAETDHAGKFQFEGLTSGQYRISLTKEQTVTAGFFPSLSIIGEEFDQTLVVIDRDIDNLHFVIDPVVTTKISGIVVNSAGIPQEGANVHFNEPHENLTAEYATTDKEGKFLLNLPVRSLKEPFMASVIAWKLISESQTYEGVGISEIELMPDISVDDLKIILKTEDELGSIVAKVHASDGADLERLSVIFTQTGFQQHFDYFTGIEEFKIRRVLPGPFSLHVFSEAEYCNKMLHLTMPEDVDVFPVDIVLEKTTRIFGRVVDWEGKPLAGVQIKFDYSLIGCTDSEGRFDFTPSCQAGGTQLDYILPGKSTPSVRYDNYECLGEELIVKIPPW